jgi:small subunit ribosomal protein S16
MVKIRLFRTGTTKRPMYRIVAMDHRRRRQGRTLEQLGTYDPRGGGTVTLREEALDKWLANGAQTSDTVASLLRRRRREAAQAAPEA